MIINSHSNKAFCVNAQRNRKYCVLLTDEDVQELYLARCNIDGRILGRHCQVKGEPP